MFLYVVLYSALLHLPRLRFHCVGGGCTVKKGQRFSSPQQGCHLPNSPWRGIIKIFPARASLVSDILAGDCKIVNLFLQCGIEPRSRPHSTRSHPLSARSHLSTRSHLLSARSNPLLARSHPLSARSHPHSARKLKRFQSICQLASSSSLKRPVVRFRGNFFGYNIILNKIYFAQLNVQSTYQEIIGRYRIFKIYLILKLYSR